MGKENVRGVGGVILRYRKEGQLQLSRPELAQRGYSMSLLPSQESPPGVLLQDGEGPF